MPNPPLLSSLPPEALARLRALNPEFTEELTPAEPQQEAEPMEALEARMQEAYDAAWSAFLAYAALPPPTLPVPPVHDDGGANVLRWAGATVAFLYIFIKAGAFA